MSRASLTVTVINPGKYIHVLRPANPAQNLLRGWDREVPPSRIFGISFHSGEFTEIKKDKIILRAYSG